MNKFTRPSFLIIFISTITLTSCKKNINIGNKIYVVERASEKMAVIDISTMELLHKIPMNANLRHVSMVFDAALKYGYTSTRNGRLARIDLETMKYAGYLPTSKNSIGLAISQDGKTVAVSEYKPGGITLIDVESFKVVQMIKSTVKFKGKEITSRITGLVDAGNNTFVCALMDAQEIWVIGKKNPSDKNEKYSVLHRIKAAAANPFDAMITPEGRYYVTGHFDSNIASLVDLWNITKTARTIKLEEEKVSRIPVKMPHMEAWAMTSGKIFVPAPGVKKLYVLSGKIFKVLRSIKLIGDPVYAVVHPNQREIWVTFSGDVDGKIQIINTQSEKTKKILDVGKKIYHLVFTPKGEKALVSSNMTNEFIAINPFTYKVTKKIKIDSPSGIFGVWRAFQIGL